MSEEEGSISPEEYSALMEKLTSVEEKVDGFMKSTDDGKVDEAISGLVKTIEKMAEEIAVLKESDPIDVSKMATIEDIVKVEDFEKLSETNATILDRLDVIEKTPFFKGTKEGDPKGDVNKGADPDDLVGKIIGANYGMEV